jgi:hypothetical protein
MAIVDIPDSQLRNLAHFTRRLATLHRGHKDEAGAVQLEALAFQFEGEAEALQLPPFVELAPLKSFSTSSPATRGEPHKTPLPSELAHKAKAPPAPAPTPPKG